jgi:hypothetical protein
MVLKSVFEKIDESNFHIGGFYPANIVRNVHAWRAYFKVIVAVALFSWVFFGFDSVINQFSPLYDNFWNILFFKANWSAILQEMYSIYGKGNHFSAVVFYGVSWLILQSSLEKVGIKRSFNFFMVMMLTLLNMGIFETLWNRTCAYFQNLPWLLKQPTNIVQYNAWMAVGVLAIIYLYMSGYKLNINKVTLSLVVLSVAIWLFWIYYPFPIQQISVQTTMGVWNSTKLFPQTLYTVDLNPTDNINTGVYYYVQNNGIHFVNDLAKIIITTTIMLLVSVKKRIVK